MNEYINEAQSIAIALSGLNNTIQNSTTLEPIALGEIISEKDFKRVINIMNDYKVLVDVSLALNFIIDRLEEITSKEIEARL